MSAAVRITVAAAMVACGDTVRGEVVGAGETRWAGTVQLQCRVRSASPRDVTMATQVLDTSRGAPAAFRLAVPARGPITMRGQTLSVSWVVAVVDAAGDVVAEAPVVVAPRGGVALWLQRHAPPPT